MKGNHLRSTSRLSLPFLPFRDSKSSASAVELLPAARLDQIEIIKMNKSYDKIIKLQVKAILLRRRIVIYLLFLVTVISVSPRLDITEPSFQDKPE